MRSDSRQLQLIRESVYDPRAEEEAKKLLLGEIYGEVRAAYAGRAANGGLLADLPSCVGAGRICGEDMSFTYNAVRVMLSRYLSKDSLGRIVETPSMLMKRVALGFKTRVNPDTLYKLLVSRRFMFNSPTLFNMYADGARGALSACYVTPIYDNIYKIMEASLVQAMTFKYGGGQGFSFSNLRPRWSVVKGTGSYSSGPVSFLKIFDTVTDAVKQGGKRRGANMGVLHDWHPDIYNPWFQPSKAYRSLVPLPTRKLLRMLIEDMKEEGLEPSEELEIHADGDAVPVEEAGFIQAKRWPLGDVFLTNFNISVGVHDAFMEAVIHDKEWWMVNPQLSEITTGDGDYRVHYSVSRATGLGRLTEFTDKIKTPFFSILEDEVEKAKRKAGEILAKLDMSPDTKNPYAWRLSARKLWSEIIRGAWETGDPGVLYLDNHNKWNPTPWLGAVVATNPCVSGDTLVLIPGGVARADTIYRSAKVRGVGEYFVVADPDVLGEGGKPRGYETLILAPSRVDGTLGLAVTKAIAWHVGRKKGLKLKLSTGHEVTVTPDHKLLVVIDGEEKFVEAEKIAKLVRNGASVKVSVYLFTTFRAEKPTPETVRNSKIVAVLLLSDYKVAGSAIELKPMHPIVEDIVYDAFHYCSVERTVDGFKITCSDAAKIAGRDIYKLIEATPVSVLAEAGYLIGTMLSGGVKLTPKLRERLHILAFIAQLAGWVLQIEGDEVRAVRARGSGVVYGTVLNVEEVEADFYDFTVPGYHMYIAGGLIHHNCGEQPLYPFESCNLGSMSIEKYVEGGRFDLGSFYRDVQVVVDAMDAVIDLNKHPDPRQAEANKFTRKIGLGIMGLADALAKLGYPYDSEEAVAFTLIVAAALEVFGWKRSWELGAKLGHAPAFECRVFDWRTMKCLEKAEPEELLEMHTPALVKASMVSTVTRDFDGEWLVVKYHDVEMPRKTLDVLGGEARYRVMRDGSVKLVKWSAVEHVLRKVFNVTEETYLEAIHLAPEAAAESPRHLLALAVYAPVLAWEKLAEYGRIIGARAPRNTTVTTVAPTGTISIIAGTSSGIEPYFALVYRRVVSVGDFLEVVRVFRDMLLDAASRHGVEKKVLEEVFDAINRNKGSLRWALAEIHGRIKGSVPDGFVEELEKLARLFATAMDFDPWYHLAHNAAAQLYVDQSISKTVNLARDAPEETVETVYLVAWLLGLKGVTVYRDESKSTQVIVTGGESGRQKKRLIRRTRPRIGGAYRLAPAPSAYSMKTGGFGGSVVVGEDENSTCKTCHL